MAGGGAFTGKSDSGDDVFRLVESGAGMGTAIFTDYDAAVSADTSDGGDIKQRGSFLVMVDLSRCINLNWKKSA